MEHAHSFLQSIIYLRQTFCYEVFECSDVIETSAAHISKKSGGEVRNVFSLTIQDHSMNLKMEET